MTNTMTDLQAQRAGFRDELISVGHLVPLGIDGLYGRGGEFEAIIDGVGRRIRAVAAEAFATPPRVLRFPPVFARQDFEHTDYIASFPDLTGTVNTFLGGEREHRALLADRDAGAEWDAHLAPAGTALVSAACHPVYARLTGILPAEGALVDVHGYCFRHEPAIDPARMQAFRMREYVRVGTPSQATAHRDEWVGRAAALLGDLGLDVTAEPANDPFFGRAGRMLAAGQREDALKTELTVRLYGPDAPVTAIASCNYHRDHFGVNFAIESAGGAPAHSACVGFGMERIALALLRTHGLHTDRWTPTLRAVLQ